MAEEFRIKRKVVFETRTSERSYEAILYEFKEKKGD